jgi:phosphoglycolate phosphatase
MEHLLSLCEKLGVSPARVAYIGDWAQDMRAARDAGLIPIGLTRGHKTSEVLHRNGASLVLEHLADLQGIVR